MTLSYIFLFSLSCLLPWELYPLDAQLFQVIFHILYIRITPSSTFSLFILTMDVKLRRNVGGFVKCILKISLYLQLLNHFHFQLETTAKFEGFNSGKSVINSWISNERNSHDNNIQILIFKLEGWTSFSVKSHHSIACKNIESEKRTGLRKFDTTASSVIIIYEKFSQVIIELFQHYM